MKYFNEILNKLIFLNTNNKKKYFFIIDIFLVKKNFTKL